MKILDGCEPIQVLPEPSEMASWFVSHAVDAVKKSQLLITKIMTSLLMLCGYANLATNSVTKNLKKNSDHDTITVWGCQGSH